MRTIYYHGTILTMDETQEKAQAVLVEDGMIKAVGSEEEILKQKQKEDVCIDLEGHTMLPAFIDAHSHFVGVANSLAQCDLKNCLSFQEIVMRMKAFIKEHAIAQGEWVMGSGYDHNFLIEQAHPTKYVLDEISTLHPIVIVHTSSHMGVANSMALQLMNINENTKDVIGGKYYRIPNSQEPDGHMEETAFIQFQNALPMPNLETMMELIKQAQRYYASYGITTVQEGMVAAPLFALLEEAAKRQLLYLDVIGYIDLAQHRYLTKKYPNYVKTYVNHFKIGGYKIFLDGSPQGRTAWMKTPYVNAENGYCGYPTKSDEQLYELIVSALQDHLQLLAHCNGDAAAEQYITQFTKALTNHSDSMRPVMIHAQLVQQDQLKRMKHLSMIPSFFIAHTYYWGDIHIQNFGRKRASTISPAKDAQRLKLCYTFHQDSPVVPPNMLHTLWCAVNRMTRNGDCLGKEERITPYEALKAITKNAAYQYFEEDRKGSITKGKVADLVILDQNPLTIDPNKIKDICVLETIKEGKTIFRMEEKKPMIAQ